MESSETSSFLNDLSIREHMWKTYGISWNKLMQMDSKAIRKILIMCDIKSEVSGK